MSDMRKYVNIINEAVKPAQLQSSLQENKAKRGDMVKTKNGFATVAKVFDDGYMIKLHADQSAAEVDFDQVAPVDRQRDIGRGTVVRHAEGMAKIVKVFGNEGYMIKFDEDGSTREVDVDEVVFIK